MPHRMFVALVPPAPVKEHLAEFLSARPQQRWIDEDQWHLTLAFMAAVPDHREEDLADALAAVAARHRPFELRLAGAGAFPHPGSARALWLAGHAHPASGDDPLTHLATSCRAAASSVGAPPDGKGFTAHLTLARLRRPVEATKWVRVLDTFEDSWQVEDLELIASYLGEGPNGRPRYETRARLLLAAPADAGADARRQRVPLRRKRFTRRPVRAGRASPAGSVRARPGPRPGSRRAGDVR